jgi:choline dehydrogenase-like flavoprotein
MCLHSRASAIDHICRTHHPNLFLLGSSDHQASGAANPTLTTATLALRTADTIQRFLGCHAPKNCTESNVSLSQARGRKRSRPVKTR